MSRASVDPQILRSRTQSARRWIERIQKTKPRTFDKNLGGLCARGAFRLAKTIQEAGLPAVVKVVEAWGGMHCYVQVENYICDVTSTQFGGPKVLVRSKDHNRGFVEPIYRTPGVNLTYRVMNPKRIYHKFNNFWSWGHDWSPQPADFKKFDKKNYKRPR